MVKSRSPKSWALCLLAVLSSSLQLSSADEDYPLGISLGHMQLSSAYYNAANEIITVATIDSSVEWQNFVLNTYSRRELQGPEHDPGRLAMYARTLQQIEQASSSALGHPVTIRSVVGPQHFNSRPGLYNLKHAAYKAGYIRNNYQANQVTCLHNAARLAYDLDNCESFGLPADCDLWESDVLVMIVEYNELYLSLGFYATGWYLFTPWKTEELLQYGEAALFRLMPSNEMTSTPYLPLIQTVQTFTIEALEDVQSKGITNPVDALKAIILVGEASDEGMKDMQKLLKMALPDFEAKFRFSIKPNTLGATGAAKRARDFILDPGPEDEDGGSTLMPPDGDHNEL